MYLILAIILNNTLRKNTNPTVLIMYVTDKLIRQMRNSTLELDLNYELQYMGVKTNKNTMHLTLDMYVCLTIPNIFNNSFSLFYHGAFSGLKLV